MTEQTKNRPVHEIRFGRIKATIWRNETENGERFNATLTRLYRVDEDQREGPKDKGWRETTSFGREDLLLVAKVADLAHTWMHSQNGESTTEDEAA